MRVFAARAAWLCALVLASAAPVASDGHWTVGEWSVVWDAWFRDSLQYTLVLSAGGGFFWVALTLWLCVGASVLAYMRRKRDQVTGMVHFLARLDVRVDVPKFYTYLRARGVRGRSADCGRRSSRCAPFCCHPVL